jgi:hypothetical protein
MTLPSWISSPEALGSVAASGARRSGATAA